MNLLDLLEQISEFKSANFTDLDKLELSELERYIRKLDNIRTAMEHRRHRRLNKPVVQSKYYSVKEAAEKLKVTSQTIYNLVESGKLNHSRVGNAIRISEEQIQEYLKNG